MPENVTSKVYRYEIKPKPGPIPPSKDGSFQHRLGDRRQKRQTYFASFANDL